MPLLHLDPVASGLDSDGSPLSVYGPVLPISPPPDSLAYHGLLTNPPGKYGRAAYGNAMAYTLRGEPAFARKAENLFGSFGGESLRGEDGYHYATSLVLRPGTASNVWFFCMPMHRVKSSIRVYLYGQLCRSARADWVDLLDDEGDFVETTLINGHQLMHEASCLAESFYLYEIKTDYSAIPDLTTDPYTLHHVEHVLHAPSSQHEQQD